MEKRNSVLDWFKYFKNNFLLDACAGLIAFAIGMIISIIMWKTGVMEGSSVWYGIYDRSFSDDGAFRVNDVI